MSKTLLSTLAMLPLLGSSLVMAEGPADVPEGEPAIRLESTFVGDKEQPAVSYFIPWQGTSTPDKLQWNLEDKHDATLNPVDREVMLRSINMYNEMNLENN